MEKKRRKNLISIIIGLVIGLSLVTSWTIYLLTLPDMNEQLEHSFFTTIGVYKCQDENYDFTITNIDYNVTGLLNYQNATYEFNIDYLATRGFNHKYAFVIKLNCESKGLYYSCFGDFKENEFTLKKFSGQEKTLFIDVKELHFIKV